MIQLIRTVNIWIQAKPSINIFIRYLIVGSCNTLICLSLLGFGYWLGLHYLVYTALAYGITICVSFTLNLFFTFRVRGAILKRLFLFLFFNLLNLLSVEIIEYGLIEWGGIRPVLAILGGMCCFTGIGFVLNRYVVYI